MLVSADAMHTQRAHTRFLVEGKHADYLLVVKDNQPVLFSQLQLRPLAHSARHHLTLPGPWPP